jgi:hypothetical protein
VLYCVQKKLLATLEVALFLVDHDFQNVVIQKIMLSAENPIISRILSSPAFAYNGQAKQMKQDVEDSFQKLSKVIFKIFCEFFKHKFLLPL